MDPWALVYMIIIAIIWGFTNPMMKQSAKGIEKCSRDGGSGGTTSWISNFLLEIKFLITNWKVKFISNITHTHSSIGKHFLLNYFLLLVLVGISAESKRVHPFLLHTWTSGSFNCKSIDKYAHVFIHIFVWNSIFWRKG